MNGCREIIVNQEAYRTVGRESKAHPAFRIIASPDAEGERPPPVQGYKCRFEPNGGSLNKGNPQIYPPDRSNRAPVQKNMAPGIKTRMMAAGFWCSTMAEGGMRFAFPPYGYSTQLRSNPPV
jgi:hypothetical protein